MIHPDLLPYLEDTVMGPMVKHPLCFDYAGTRPDADINKHYQIKCDALLEHAEAGEWSHCVWLYEKPHRLAALLTYADRMTDFDYWQTFRDVFRNVENQWQCHATLNALLDGRHGSPRQMMNPQERAFFDRLPPELDLFRGVGAKGTKLGFSWTLSRTRANWFASRFRDGGKVYRVLVPKEYALAYLDGNESEIVLRPGDAKKASLYDVSQRVPVWYGELYDKCKTVFGLGQNSIHGWSHWDAVADYGVRLARTVRGASTRVVQAFALIHDCCRQDDNADAGHGVRASDMIDELLADTGLILGPSHRKKLYEAVRFHNDPGLTTSDPVVSCCWDADRCDLIRLGITPNPVMMSTAYCRSGGLPYGKF